MKKGFKLTEMLTGKKSVKDRIGGIKAELSRMPALSTLEVAAGDARLRLDSFINQHGGSEGKVPNSRRGDFLTLKRNLDEAVQSVHDAKTKEQRLREDLEDLNRQLADAGYVCSEDEVRGYQMALAAAKQKAAALRESIAAQEELIKGAEAGIQDMDDLLKKREDLLANIATGEAREEDLKTLEQQILKRNKAASHATEEAERTANQARQTIAGLKRKLGGIEEEIEKLDTEVLPAAMVGYLQARAEVAAGEYMQAVSSLRDHLQQLIGIGALIGKYPEGEDIVLSHDWSKFKLPAFRLNACEAYIVAREISCFGPDGVNPGEAARAESEKIRAMGINL